MERVVLIRYGEIAVKTKRIRRMFERRMIRNIERALVSSDISCFRIEYEYGRMYVALYRDEDVRKAVDVLTKVFGVKSVSPAIRAKLSTLDKIRSFAAKVWSDIVRGKRFAVRCRRVGSHSFTSKDVERAVGAELKPISGGVDLERPDVELHVEIRGDDVYFYHEVIRGPGGLPLGTQGKALALISGGFDSPVAAWMVMKRGVCVDALHFSFAGYIDMIPALKVMYKLFSEWSWGYSPKIYIVDAQPLVSELSKVSEHLRHLVFKRIMYAVAERIAKMIGAKAIVTGESLGQVSSQTLHNLYATEHGIGIPILRPLIGLDKDEIVRIAEMIGTYECSKEVEEFCAIFSAKPRTRASPEELDDEMKKIDASIVDKLASSIKRYSLRDAKALIESFDRRLDLEIDHVPENSIVLDLRDEEKYREWHVKGAIRVDLHEVENVVQKLGTDKTYVLYCSSGITSKYVASILRSRGIRAYSLNLRRYAQMIGRANEKVDV